MHRYKPWTVIFYALAFSALTWHVFYPPFTYLRAGYSLAQWGWILYIAIVGTVVPWALFLGDQPCSGTRASITATLEPIFAGFLAFIFLEKAFLLPQIAGVAWSS